MSNKLHKRKRTKPKTSVTSEQRKARAGVYTSKNTRIGVLQQAVKEAVVHAATTMVTVDELRGQLKVTEDALLANYRNFMDAKKRLERLSLAQEKFHRKAARNAYKHRNGWMVETFGMNNINDLYRHNPHVGQNRVWLKTWLKEFYGSPLNLSQPGG